MYCCINCFKDAHIRNMIKKIGTKGDCDFCSSKDVAIYDISSSNELSDKIIALVKEYSVSDDVDAKLLKESLRDDWDIFNGGIEGIQTLVKALCSHEISQDDDIFIEKVFIPQMRDEDFLDNYAAVRGLTWKEFSDYIKYTNRFHNTYFNTDAFATLLSMSVKSYDEGSSFFRARICSVAEGYQCDEMYGPPMGKRNAGRINPEEMGVLYLSYDKETILYETRANVYDFVSIGEFKTKQKIRLFDLSGIAKVSPFDYGDIAQFAVNREVFREMSKEIAKPVRRSDSPLEYLPTQFIAEFVKSQNYDGVEYESTIKRGGRNIALFDENLVECVDVNTVEITDIKYSTNC